MKTQLKKITILWHEGNQATGIPNNTELPSFAEAQKAIMGIYQHNPGNLPDMGYDKLKFILEWQDGESYEGRLDMCQDDDNPFDHDNLIAWHCLRFLNYHSAKSEENLKANTEFLAKYSFTD